jgi:hypothetical protein
VFTEVFLIQIRQKFREIRSEVCVQGKKKFGKRVPKLKTRDKKGNSTGKKRCGGWDENQSIPTGTTAI